MSQPLEPRSSALLLPLLLTSLAVAAVGCCPRSTITPDAPVSGPTPLPAVDVEDASEEIRAVLEAFEARVRGADFEAAFALLSGRHRARYSVETLRRDHQSAGSEAGAFIDRLRAALAGEAEILLDAEGATFSLGGGLSVGLVREEGGWRIDRLR